MNFYLSGLKVFLNDNAKILLVGNKCDLENKREVSFQEGEEFANFNEMEFIETSAKTGKNVDKAFNSLLEGIIISKSIFLYEKTNNLLLKYQSL